MLMQDDRVLIGLQTLMSGPFWDRFWTLASSLYSETLLIVPIPILFWLGRRRFARFFVTALFGQIWLMSCLKGLWAVPRPSGRNLRILSVNVYGPYARPSGHAFGSAVLYGGLALVVRRRWATALAVILSVLVGLSRLYLGLHWPADVLIGWLFGVGLLWVAWAAWPALSRLADRLPFGWRLPLAALLPAGMVLLWQSLPFVARTGLSVQYTAQGTLAGLWLGSLLEERYLQATPLGGSPGRRALLVLAGLVLLLLLRTMLKIIVPAGDWFGFLRYAVIGFAVSFAVPWLFERLRLSAGGGEGRAQ